MAYEFGINSKAVLVADTVERNNISNVENNAMQRERGKMLDIHTVSDPQQINTIEIALAQILNITVPKKNTPPVPASKPVPKQTNPPKAAPNFKLESDIKSLQGPGFLEQQQVQLLIDQKISTVKEFIEQSPEKLQSIKNSRGISLGDQYLSVQKKLKESFGIK